jgi:glycosyltransferase involved in cell wall biosynthesis
MNVVCIVDIGSYTLPYDYNFIKEVTKYFHVEFFCSDTKYNQHYIEQIQLLDNVTVHCFNISQSVAKQSESFVGLFSAYKLLLRRRKKYLTIHFQWMPLGLFDVVFALIFFRRALFTFHNPLPHESKKLMTVFLWLMDIVTRNKVFVSSYSLKRYRQIFGIRGRHYLVCHGIMPVPPAESMPLGTRLPELKAVFWGRVTEYKGVEMLADFSHEEPLEVWGKWASNCQKHRTKFSTTTLIQDFYLSDFEIHGLFSRGLIFLLPYKQASQSGVLYTFIAETQVFVASDTGDIGDFLCSNELEDLVFQYGDQNSFRKALAYARQNFSLIKEKLIQIRSKYEWSQIADKNTILQLYSGRTRSRP